MARRRVRFPDGVEVEHSIVRHRGAVGLVVLDEQGRWLLVRQYRIAPERELLEIPAGGLEEGEEPDQTAHREVREETGFAAASMERLGGLWMAPGFCTEYMHFYLATGLTHDPLPGDADERISAPLAMTEAELLAAIDDGRIEDAKTVVAVALMARYRAGEGRVSGPRLLTQTQVQRKVWDGFACPGLRARSARGGAAVRRCGGRGR